MDVRPTCRPGLKYSYSWLWYVYSEDHNCTFVLVNIAISRSWEDSQRQRLLVRSILVLIAWHLHLVASNYHSKSVFLEKFGGVVAGVEIWARPVFVSHPLLLILVERITPKQIAQNSWLRNLRKTIYFYNIICVFRILLILLLCGEMPACTAK